MELSDAVRTANWLSDNFRTWLASDDKSGTNFINYPVITYPPDYIHASSIAHCPKRAALERHGKLERTFDDYMLLRMREGTAMGKVLVEYIRDLAIHHNESPTKEHSMAYNYEHQLVDDDNKFVGRADLMCWFHTDDKVEYWPIECKLTDAWQYDGLTLDHFAQTASYIRLQRLKGICDTGFVFTMYDKKDAPVAWKVWIVQRNAEDNGYNLYDNLGRPASVFKRFFLADTDLDAWLNEHHAWDRMVESGQDLTNTTPYLDPSEHWMCAKVVPAVPRERAWKGEPAGSPRAKTGIVYIRCPVFAHCWGDWLLERGINPTGNLPRELRIGNGTAS